MPISDYAIIGDCRTAALVSRNGSLDWLCWPSFESPAIFGALLDSENGGRFAIAPKGTFETTRRYFEDTAVLETTFRNDGGELRLVDTMPIRSPDEAHTSLAPEHEVLRRITCTRGEVIVDVEIDPRPEFGRARASLRDLGKLGFRWETPGMLLTLQTNAPRPVRAEDLHVRWTFTMRAGDVIDFALTCAVDAPAVLCVPGPDCARKIDRTIALWREWAARTRFDGAARERVVRSAITLRLLAFAPSGAIVAAPTTSLPERIGGDRNWDYRFCWLRDAAFTTRALVALNHEEEAHAFSNWMLHATRLTQPKLLVLYDVYGRAPPPERKLSHWKGYAGSLPVRVGNAADSQLQLDSYGEVVDAVYRLDAAGIAPDRETGSVIEGFGRYVSAHWMQPDSGIWEPRGKPKRHTHSIAMCWLALDRLVRLQEKGRVRSRHRALFEAQRSAIASVLRDEAYSHELRSYTAELGGKTVDATSLLLGFDGYESARSDRMKSTFERIVEKLSPRSGLLHRYPPKAGDSEGAFGVCSFWIAEHLARGGGTLAQAEEAFAATSAYANELGLFSEEFDPTNGSALGNFPQVFTHVGHLNAALSLAERTRTEVSR